MAKKHKNLDNILIQWDGDLSHPEAGNQGQSIPASVDLGTWGGYVPCWYPDNPEDCVIEDMYWEDFNVSRAVHEDTDELNVADISAWSQPRPGGMDRPDIVAYMMTAGDLCIGGTFNYRCIQDSVDAGETKYLAPKKTYTWGDVSFVQEIADGIGTGSRRAREARLHKFDKDTKKRLIHLICRVKGEKVYDEEKEVGDIQIKLEDVDLVIKEVLGKMRVENTNVL